MKPASFGTRRALRISACGLALAAVIGAFPRAFAQGNKVVYVVINAPAGESIDEIKYKFEQAKKRTDGRFNCDGIVIEPVTAQVFGLLNSIVLRGAEAVREMRDSGERQGIERLAGEANAWVVNLGNAAFIESATVGVAGGDAPSIESVEVAVGAAAGKQGVEIVGHSPGRYVVRTKPGVRPLSLRAKVTDLSGAERELDAEFPAADTGLAYLVTLNGVKGEAKALFTALADKTKVANPILEMNDVPLIVANFVPRRVTDPDIFEFVDGTLRFVQPVDKGVNPKRLWLFFAPTNADREAEKRRVTAGGFQAIPKLVREKRVTLPPSAAGLGARGGWVEVAPLVVDPNGGRRFEVGVKFDLAAWRQAVTDAAAEANEEVLMIYEFEADDEPSPIKVGADYVVTKKLPRFVRSVIDAK